MMIEEEITVVEGSKLDDALKRLGGNVSMRRDRPYLGQAHTSTGERGRTEVKGITFRDLRDCFIRAVFLAGGAGGKLYTEAEKGERAIICENDLYGWDLDTIDPMAVEQALSCEVERLMGIYPNLPRAT